MRRYLRRPFRPCYRFPVIVPPVLITFLVAVVMFSRLSARLEPLIETLAVSNAVNQISTSVSSAAAEAMFETQLNYDNFVDLNTDSDGQVTSLSFQPIAGTRFKQTFISLLCRQLEAIESQDLAVPVGNLTGTLWLSALGPDVRVLVRSIGDVTAEYEHEFTSVGVNQTRHAVYLKVAVVIQLMIPGKIIPVAAEERVCIAETVIVGDVPNTYLNLQDGDN